MTRIHFNRKDLLPSKTGLFVINVLRPPSPALCKQALGPPTNAAQSPRALQSSRFLALNMCTPVFSPPRLLKNGQPLIDRRFPAMAEIETPLNTSLISPMDSPALTLDKVARIEQSRPLVLLPRLLQRQFAQIPSTSKVDRKHSRKKVTSKRKFYPY